MKGKERERQIWQRGKLMAPLLHHHFISVKCISSQEVAFSESESYTQSNNNILLQKARQGGGKGGEEEKRVIKAVIIGLGMTMGKSGNI